MKENYTIGLDIGTNSVGWAVIKDNFELAQGKKRINDNGKIRKSKTNLWGVRLFEEGQVAADRRLKRGQRRRIARRKERLNYLRGIFEEEILKIDESFFIRLDESFLQDETINNRNNRNVAKHRYPLFNQIKGLGETYTNEAGYYKQYPTIYHLRNRLVNDKNQADIRLVYLAMHHILKYRGHFIDEEKNRDFNDIDIQTSLINLMNAWNELFIDKQVSTDKNSEIEKVLKLKSSPTIKVERILGKHKVNGLLDEKNINFTSPKEFEQVLKFLVGNQGNFKTVFGLDEDLKLSVKDDDEKFKEKLEKLPEEQRNNIEYIIELAQKVNNDMELSESLLNGSLSSKMIEKYNQHKNQLKQLRVYLMDYPKLYQKIFGLPINFSHKNKGAIAQAVNESQEGIYTKYIQGLGKDKNATYATKLDEFYTDLKKAFSDKKYEQPEFPEWIQKAMDTYDFLPKQRVYTNGSIPYQVHLEELKQIIKNQSQYYDFLKLDKNNEFTDELDQTKIALLMRFRIPYYVGTLSKNVGWIENENGELIQTNAKSKNSWNVRKENAPDFRPWNFDDAFDRDKSAVNFIKRMTSFDTYLPDQKVLPKHSILMQKFNVLNRLTKVKIKGHFLSDNARKAIFNDLFSSKAVSGKVTKRNLRNYVNANKQLFPEVINDINYDDIFGIDGRGFLETFTTIHDLNKVGFSIDELTDGKNEKDIEKIIEWLTVYEDKKIFKKRFSDVYGNVYVNAEVDELADLTKRYKGWGRFSRKLLTGIYDNNQHNILWYLANDEANREFMQLINDQNLPFKSMLEKQLAFDDKEKLSYDLVENLATSPANKRGIWQSIQIVAELVEYMGYTPSNIAIEFARENQTTAQGTKDERKKTIEKALDKLKIEFKSDIVESKNSESFKALDNRDFNDRLQLYYLQNGRDMYDGTKLEISELSSYEVDHIIPQSLIKNDSLENKVLTKKENNDRKLDGPAGAIANKDAKALWQRLSNAGVLSQVKLARLRKTEFTENDIKGFINRQLVETRQIMKHVATILKEQYLDENGKSQVEILTPKAMYADGFKKQLGIVKVLRRNNSGRVTLNDFHHAQDAYMNAIVGLFRKRMGYDSAYTRIIAKIKEQYGDKPNMAKERATELRKQSFQQLNDMDVKVYKWHKTIDGLREKVFSGEYRKWIDNETGEIWWDKSVIDQIFGTIDSQKMSELPLITFKKEKQRGSYSKEGNLKAGNGSLVRKNNLSINRYGGNNADSTNIALLHADGSVESINLVNFDEKQLKIGDKVLDRFQLIKNNNYGLELGKADLNNLKKFYTGKDSKGIQKTLLKIANFKGIEPDEFINELAQIKDKEAKIDEIINSSLKPVYRYLTAPFESQKAQQFVLSQAEMKDLRDFMTSRDESINLNFEIVDKMLDFAMKTGSVSEIDKVCFKELFDKLPTQNKVEGSSIKAYGKITVVEQLLKLIGRGASRGLTSLKQFGLSEDTRYKSTRDVINSNTILINQSITGLYETRITIRYNYIESLELKQAIEEDDGIFFSPSEVRRLLK